MGGGPDPPIVMGKCVQNIVRHLDTSHMMHNAFKLVRGVGEVSQSQTKKKRPPKVTVGAFCKLREPHGSKLGRSDGKEGSRMSRQRGVGL